MRRLQPIFALLLSFLAVQASAQFKVISFFTGRHDPAHISFVSEANEWFAKNAHRGKFSYDTTSNWSNLNDGFLSRYDVVVFLDTRPEAEEQRRAFRRYMNNGGAWLGFHFAAFALDNSAYPDNWSWYSDTLIACGSYRSNTWKPTPETVRVELPSHPVCDGLPPTFVSAPNEWYRWENDLRANPDITVLLSLDPSTFPVGTGPKPNEIWHDGDYPVAWIHEKYRMVYVNMGHDDIDYGGTNKSLSSTFSSAWQSRFILQSLLWLGKP